MTILEEIRADGARREASFQEFRREVSTRFDRMDQRLATLEVKIADVKSDLMKWSFVFWCGAVASVAALAGVLR